jgi:hypothetical protein
LMDFSEVCSVFPAEVGCVVAVEVTPEVVAVVCAWVAEEDVVTGNAACALVLAVVLLVGTGIAPPKFSGLVAIIELVLCVSVLTTI